MWGRETGSGKYHVYRDMMVILSLCGWNAIYQYDDCLGNETVLSGVVSEGPECSSRNELVFNFLSSWLK